ncbi:HipA domain-containing protein [Arenimonas sp.]|uniref:HipA domain-containing protein n=1 Tax=Arenimonas sp. TaxID=1872635 RepID=UPI0025C7382F|nr:HipA domain-containing protein [Arenimonas sp.]
MVTPVRPGRKAKPAKALMVWMNGEEVGLWQITPAGSHQFTYSTSWQASPQFRPISLSIPATGRPVVGEAVVRYFENLLPDRDEFRRAMRDNARLASTSEFDLLAHYGRDCVGAVTLLPQGEVPEPVTAMRMEALSDADVAAVLRGATLAPSVGGELRLSLAGAQSKTALTFWNGRWNRPLGVTPTTHILKLPMGMVGDPPVPFHHSVDNEHLCSVLMGQLGFEIAPTQIACFEDQRVLAVERFDRAMAPGGYLLRLPQEDMCQALGAPRAAKYEHRDGGPGIQRIDELLRFSRDAQRDRATFLRANIVFWLLAATDGHAKNFSLRLEPGGGYRLAPLYDVMTTYPVIGGKAGTFDRHKLHMAMAPPGTKNRHFAHKEIRLRHWQDSARALGLDFNPAAMLDELAGNVDHIAAATEAMMPRGIDDHTVSRTLDLFVRATKRAATGAAILVPG